MMTEELLNTVRESKHSRSMGLGAVLWGQGYIMI